MKVSSEIISSVILDHCMFPVSVLVAHSLSLSYSHTPLLFHTRPLTHLAAVYTCGTYIPLSYPRHDHKEKETEDKAENNAEKQQMYPPCLLQHAPSWLNGHSQNPK
jgi:hypothetical protein